MPPLPATGLPTWGPSRLRAVIRLLLAEHCLPVDSDLTGFPASHAIWDDHGPAAARSEPRFDLLPKGPTRTGLTPETSVSSRCRPHRSRVFKFDRPGPRPRRVKAFLGPQQKVCIGRYVRTDCASAHIRSPRARWPHCGVNSSSLNNQKHANRRLSHALTLLF